MSFKHKTTAIFLAVVFLLSLDRFFKVLALLGETMQLIRKFADFGLSKNYGIAFSLPLYGWPVWLLVGAIILFLVKFAIEAYAKRDLWLLSACSLVIAGAASNLYDRLCYGFVVDYLEIAYFSVLNLADIMIFIGIVCLLWRQNETNVQT